MAIEPWLEDLDEDWKSERLSSSLSLPHSTPDVPSRASINSAASQSRIPRISKSSQEGSLKNNYLRPRSQRGLARSKKSSALSEHSPSQLNIANRQSENQSRKPSVSRENKGGSKPGNRASTSSLPRRASGASFSHSLQSVQHNTLPDTTRNRHEGGTPEWKKRLLNGQNAASESTDLFGPTKLEGIFQQPGFSLVPAESDDNTKPWSLPLSSSGSGTDFRQSQQSMRASRTRATEMETVQEETEEEESLNLTKDDANELPLSAEPAVNDFENDDSVVRKEEIPQQSLSGSSHDEIGMLNDLENDPRLRTVSGMEEIRNEGISPITMSRTNTLQMPPKGSWKRQDSRSTPPKPSEKRKSQAGRPLSPSSDSAIYERGESMGDRVDNSNEFLADLTSNSLPDDLSVGTQDFVTKGGFVNIRRGGYSKDNSFLRRNLSSSSMPPRRDQVSEPSSLQFRSSPPAYRKEPPSDLSRPVTPSECLSTSTTHRSQNFESTPSPVKSPGSPLKLFGNYDTFTNKRLLTRIGQFEDDSVQQHEEPREVLTREQHESRSKSEQETYKMSHQPETPSQSKRKRWSQFGNGELDHHAFTQNFSRSSSVSSNKVQPHQRIFDYSPDVTPEGIVTSEKMRFKSTSLPRVRKNASQQRQQMSTTEVEIHKTEFVEETKTRIEIHESKHGLNSPGKDRTPKRRRTLQKKELESQIQYQGIMSPREQLPDPVQIAGKKRKDARYENGGSTADPQILASRQILRPKTARRQSSGRRNPHTKNDNGSDAQAEDVDASGLSAADEELVSAITQKVASVGADISRMAHETRKKSVTTQDFLDEANRIMALIREKGKEKAGLEILEEPVNESEESDLPSDLESTKENFSRPPSREGGGPKPFAAKNQDPRVISHLRKYADEDDQAAGLVSSVTSLKIQDVQPMSPLSFNETAPRINSSPGNIRIRDSLEQRKRRHSSSTQADASPRRGTLKTQSSEGTMTGRSFPTTSSKSTKSSGQKGNIPPGKVDIPEQLGQMNFDPSSKTWVRSKASAQNAGSRKDRTSRVEEDPFEDIPDLSVDELQEHARLLPSPSRTSPLKIFAESPPRGSRNQNFDIEQPQSRPSTQESAQIPQSEASSAPSKFTYGDSTAPMPDTRATSWATTKHTLENRFKKADSDVGRDQRGEEAEHEIAINEGRVSRVPGSPNSDSRQPRVVTIQFSSPLVSGVVYQHDRSVSNSTAHTDERQPLEDAAFLHEPSTAPARQEKPPSGLAQSARKVSAPLAPRRKSAAMDFVARPISRIDERDEDDLNNEMSLVHIDNSAGLVTPNPQKYTNNLVVPHTEGKDSSLICLTPLSEFTVHQIDDPLHLEMSYVAQRMHPTSLKQAHGQLALAVDDLMKAITDAEPYEPYWEHLRRLKLVGKKLTTLHRLQEYCFSLEELDVSHNEIGQLSGVPHSVRMLNIQRNHLSNLTSWGSLRNLQYLDVSGNELESLEGFSSLVHLRELRANDNQIRNVDGILDLDGLLSLKLRGNQLDAIDFEGTELTRLTHLDLSNNLLSSIYNVHHLSSIIHLDLESNNLSALSPTETIPSLQSLKLSHNSLQTVDLAWFPYLQLLYLDNNRISSLPGLSTSQHLQALSLREQSGSPSLLNLALATTHDIRKLYLSGNACPPGGLVASSQPLLNLQFLELASCGLADLPREFGHIIPNCRVLNLNFNAVKDLTPLRGIRRLNKLLVAGNRISRMRRTGMVLAGFSALTKVDLRDNPLSIGFYPPAKREERERDKRMVLREPETEQKACFAGREVNVNDPYVLPERNETTDERWVMRLDEMTQLKRRAMELVLAENCAKLVWVDGGIWKRNEVWRLDEVWVKLKDIGVLKGSEEDDGETATGREKVEGWVNSVSGTVDTGAESEDMSSGRRVEAEGEEDCPLPLDAEERRR
ncbi:MAG: hypothetical protein Q9227_002230 [Pyrenula ochraceoflavens]